MPGVPPEGARRAAAGGGGDRAFLFGRGGRAPLFVWKTVWDTGRDAQEFFRAYNALLAGRASAAPPAGGGEAERAWREGAVVTRVRVEGDAVTIVRGAESDVAGAMPV